MYFVIDQDTIGRIRGVLEKQPDKPGNIRVYVAGMGWGGPSYGLGLDQIKEGDIVENIEGINFIMEKYMEETFGQMEVRWNGYSYAVSPANKKGKSSCWRSDKISVEIKWSCCKSKKFDERQLHFHICIQLLNYL